MNSLIREALIEGRTTEDKYEKDGYAVKWTFVNDLELIFVVSTLALRATPLQFFSFLPGSISTHPPTHLRERPSRCGQVTLCQIL